MNSDNKIKFENLKKYYFDYFSINIQEDPVLCIGYYLRYFNFFSKVIPDTKYSQKNFGKIFTP